MRQSTLVPKQEKKRDAPKLIGYCFYCGKSIFAEGEFLNFYTYFQGQLCHTACVPKPSIDEWKGRVNEILVADQLVARGFEIYFPGFSRTHVDIIARKNKHFLRLQIRTATKNKDYPSSYNVSLAVGGARWTDKQSDIDVLIVVCPSDGGFHFFCIPATLVNDQRCLGMSIESGSRYSEFLDNWSVLEEIKPNIEFVIREEESKFFNQINPAQRYAVRALGKCFTALTRGEDTEIMTRNLIGSIFLPYTPWTEEIFHRWFIRRINELVVHELIHQIDDAFGGMYKPEEEEMMKDFVKRLIWDD